MLYTFSDVHSEILSATELSTGRMDPRVGPDPKKITRRQLWSAMLFVTEVLS